MRRTHTLILFLSIIAGGVFFVGPKAQAAPNDIAITPTSVNQVVQRGSTNTGSFQVIDQGNSSYPFLIYETPYHVFGEDYVPGFTYLPNAPNVASWFTFKRTSGMLGPGQSATIDYTLTVPKNTPPGGYYAVAFAQTNSPKVPNGITLNERVGEIFYLQVAGPVKQKGTLISWDVGLLQETPLKADIRIENSGGVHFATIDQVVVQDLFGDTKFTLNTQKYILPQTIRRIPAQWNGAPAFGLFKVSGTAIILNSTDKLSTKYVLVMSRTIRVDIIIVIVIVALFVLLRSILRKIRHRSTKEPKEKPKKKS